ncbi:hemerythrin [Geomonas sp. Red276]
MVQWQESLSIGVLDVDIQHKLLFEKFNDFLLACDAHLDHEAIYRLFWFVEAYAVTHFSREEALMKELNYPGMAGHREMHRRFSEQVADFKEQLKNEGPTPVLVAAIKDFIAQWLVEHISTVDKGIGTFMNEQGAGSQ